MIRVLADDIAKITSRPMRKHLTVVASKVVAEFPSSFQDKLDDVVVGSGYNSILTQLEQIPELKQTAYEEGEFQFR